MVEKIALPLNKKWCDLYKICVHYYYIYIYVVLDRFGDKKDGDLSVTTYGYGLSHSLPGDQLLSHPPAAVQH